MTDKIIHLKGELLCVELEVKKEHIDTEGRRIIDEVDLISVAPAHTCKYKRTNGFIIRPIKQFTETELYCKRLNKMLIKIAINFADIHIKY